MSLRLLPLLLLTALLTHAAPPPAEVAEALNAFRAEGAKGWAFKQSTASRSKSLVEVFDPLKLEHERWTLLEKDGKPPSEDDLKDYREKQTRRTKGDTAPNVTKQLDLDSAELIREDAERSVYRFHLKPGDKDDTSAKHMRATFTYHKPTKAIEVVELASIEPFSPMFSVKVEEARTVVYYSLPNGERPSLLDHIEVKVRGRAMLFKSLDEDLTVKYSDYKYVSKLPQKNAQ